MIIHNCALAYSFKIQLVLPEETTGYVEETCVKPERELRPIDMVTIFIFVTIESGIQLCLAQLKIEHKKSL